MATTIRSAVEQHYGPIGLVAKLRHVLDGAKKAGVPITRESLAPLDQFHARGSELTLELAERAGVNGKMKILDVGSGLGGPSRQLANKYGATVVGVDLTKEFVDTATYLAGLLGMEGQVSYQRGDATSLPFPDGTFDLAWTQNVSQNIPEKSKLFAELFRVVKRGGLVAGYDLYSYSGGPRPTFPSFWGRDSAVSFVITPQEAKQFIRATGFKEEFWFDDTPTVIKWTHALMQALGEGKAPAGIPGLDYGLLFGQDAGLMTQNSIIDMEAGSWGMFQSVLRRPS
jgi:SAM-dependent methyltransferase